MFINNCFFFTPDKHRFDNFYHLFIHTNYSFLALNTPDFALIVLHAILVVLIVSFCWFIKLQFATINKNRGNIEIN